LILPYPLLLLEEEKKDTNLAETDLALLCLALCSALMSGFINEHSENIGRRLEKKKKEIRLFRDNRNCRYTDMRARLISNN